MIRNKYVSFVLFVLFYMVFWNLMLWVFHQDTYSFQFAGSIVLPLVVAAALGYIFFLRKKK